MKNPIATYLAERLPQRAGFRQNSVQIAYAEAIGEALVDPAKVHFIEGDAGIGKSLAYQLALAEWVARGKGKGRRGIVSTYSRSLQRQLLQPANLDVIRDYLRWQGLPQLRVGLRMGKQNYVCPQRLALHLGAVSLRHAAGDTQRPSQERQLAQWALESEGCLLDIDPTLLPDGLRLADIALTHDDPMPAALQTHIEATQSCDLLVINHALLVVDLITRGNITQAQAPHALLLDEAEHYPDVAEEILSNRISVQATGYLLRQMKIRSCWPVWEALLESLTAPGRAGSAHALSERESTLIGQGIQKLLRAKPRQANHDGDTWREWRRVRGAAEQIAARLREAHQHLALDYSPIKGLPGIVAHSSTAARSLKTGVADRVTLLTSATLSDMHHSPGTEPSFRYMHSRLQMPVGYKRCGLQQAFQATRFGRLRFRMPPGLPHPLRQCDDGAYMLSSRYAERAIPHITAVPGRTLVLCASYADVSVLSDAWPASSRNRLVTHSPGAHLNELANSLEQDAILLTPAGWEGLSPARQGDRTFWQHVVILRNPRPLRSQVERLLLEQRLCRSGMSQENAARTAAGLLNRKETVRTLHKLRQGLGRAIRHPDDTATLTLLDPRIPRPSGAPAEVGIRLMPKLLDAIPARFMAAYRQADGGSTATHGSDEAEPASRLKALL